MLQIRQSFSRSFLWNKRTGQYAAELLYERTDPDSENGKGLFVQKDGSHTVYLPLVDPLLGRVDYKHLSEVEKRFVQNCLAENT